MILGDPHWKFHPVIGIGALISGAEKILRSIFRNAERIAGILLVLFVVTISSGLTAAVICISEYISHGLRIAVEIWLCYRLLAMKSLKTESMKVYKALKSGNIEKARHEVSMIVGRDTAYLDEKGITRAAVETVAENTSDGVIAPLIFMIIGGAVGGMFYKAVNTMDSMIGYKNDRYRYFGTAAAKLDDIVNFIPARVSAFLMLAAAFVLGMDYRNGFRIFKRDRYNHKSPNSAQTEAVCAGVLGLKLAGDAYYFGELVHKPTIGDDIREIEPEDIRRACTLLYGTGIILMGLFIICSIFLTGLYGL
jgi:adenosylcobinamide-phosphate synthase